MSVFDTQINIACWMNPTCSPACAPASGRRWPWRSMWTIWNRSTPKSLTEPLPRG